MTNTLTYFEVSGDYQSVNDPEPSSTTSTADQETIQGIALFTPRVPKGFTAFVDDFEISQNSNSIQEVSLIGAINGGHFNLQFDGVWSPDIVAGATQAQVQTALEGTSTIGSGNATVVGPNGGPWVVTFTGALANAPQSALLGDPSGLTTASGSAWVPVRPVQLGNTSRTAPTAIGITPRRARLWTTGRLSSINKKDSPNVELLANSAVLNLDFDLIYDVTFEKVSWGGVDAALAPFGFLAPTDDTPICLTDPALSRLQHQAPLGYNWYPGWTPESGPTPPHLVAVGGKRDWRVAG
jgi:hypothetical protein